MNNHFPRQVLILSLFALVAGACGPAAATPMPASYLPTSVAQTWEAVQASFTATCTPITPTPLPTETATPRPTATATETRVPVPSLTPYISNAPKDSAGSPPPNLPVKPAPGYTAPDFSLEQAGDGADITLSELRGQPVIVIFWATWCGYCQKSLPILQAAYSQYHDSGLVVLGIDELESSKKVLKAGQNMGLTFPLLLDLRGKIQGKYTVTGYPTTFFIDRSGVISGKHTGQLTPEYLEKHLPGLFR